MAGLFKAAAVFVTVIVVSLPCPGWALYVPVGIGESGQTAGAADMKALESVIIQQRLRDLGLSKKEAAARASMLSDEQTHGFASNLDSLQAGAEVLDVIVLGLFVAVITVGILDLTGNSLIVR